MITKHRKTSGDATADTVGIPANSSSTLKDMDRIRYGYETVNGLRIFYREAGDPAKPAIVLLHGFPSSSHMYRNLIRELCDSFFLIAPDYPGFGESATPSADEYAYTFDNLSNTIDSFLDKRGVSKYSLYIQDFGSPVGFRIAAAHPERIQALISQNGNAYEEGIDRKTWAPIIQYWASKTPEREKTIIENVFSWEGIKWQYTHGARNPDNIAPENWNLDYMKISRPGRHQIQLSLAYDYQHNLNHYPAWQQYLRDHQPPVLIVWGKNDAFFTVAGAEGFKRHAKDIDYNILDTGHFALEEECAFIAAKIRSFLSNRGIS